MSERAWHCLPPALLADSRRTVFTSTYSAGDHVYWYTREQTYEINQTGIARKMVGYHRNKMRSGFLTPVVPSSLLRTALVIMFIGIQGSRRTRSIRQVSLERWWVTTEVRCGLVAVQARPDVAQERTTEILLAHRRLPYLELPLKVECGEVLLDVLLAPLHRLADTAHGEVECPFRRNTVRPVPVTRLHPSTENIRRVAIQAMLYTVDKESLPQVVVQPGLIVQHHVVAPPLMRTVQVEDQPIRGFDALKLKHMSPLVPEKHARWSPPPGRAT